MFGFEQNKDHGERKKFLSMIRRNEILESKCDFNTIWPLFEKWNAYSYLRPYYKRDCLKYSNSTTNDELSTFVCRHQRFFAKPTCGGCGRGARVVDIKESNDFSSLLTESPVWIFEELIIQDDWMAQWNASSVNTVRIPSIRQGDKITILDPFIRMGRSGSVIDNGAGGGIFAGVNAENGMIETDGHDELEHTYKLHPDSQRPICGCQIPQWYELRRLVEEVHLSMPSNHRYIGFDFALTKQFGWVLIELNWGDFLGQIARKRGVKDEFVKLLR